MERFASSPLAVVETLFAVSGHPVLRRAVIAVYNVIIYYQAIKHQLRSSSHSYHSNLETIIIRA